MLYDIIRKLEEVEGYQFGRKLKRRSLDMKEALFYTVEDKGKVQCRLCNNHCHIKPGKRGICRVRENRDGKLYSLVY